MCPGAAPCACALSPPSICSPRSLLFLCSVELMCPRHCLGCWTPGGTFPTGGKDGLIFLPGGGAREEDQHVQCRQVALPAMEGEPLMSIRRSAHQWKWWRIHGH